MDVSNNFISNDVNEENDDDLPDLISMDASNLIPLLPALSSGRSPIFNMRPFTLPISSIFEQNQNPFYAPLFNDMSNNQTRRRRRNRLRQQLSNNIIYQPNALYASNTNTINNIVQQSFQEPATLYKRIISDKGKENIEFSVFGGETEEICAITRCPLEKGEEIAILPCKHIFNKDAIMTWLEKKSAECPVCRYALDEKEIKKDVAAPPPAAAAARGPVARARLRNALYDMLDRRLQEDEEERIQRAILLSLRENTTTNDDDDDGTNID